MKLLKIYSKASFTVKILFLLPLVTKNQIHTVPGGCKWMVKKNAETSSMDFCIHLAALEG